MSDPVEEELLAALLPEDLAWFAEHGGLPPAPPVPQLSAAERDRIVWKHNAANRERWARPEVPYFEPPKR